MKIDNKYRKLIESITFGDKYANKAIYLLIKLNPNKYMFYSGIYVSIASSVLINSINLVHSLDNILYIIMHYLLIVLSFIATLILAYLADIASKIDVSAANEFCRLDFDITLANNKKNQFENSLKNIFNILGDINNQKLIKQFKKVFLLRLICLICVPVCLFIIIILIYINNTSGGAFI